MKTSFPPLSNPYATTLILGSLPGELSLSKGEYYGHSRNAFWQIMFDLLGEPYSPHYDEKCQMLLRHHIALWDVVCSAERKGSLDSQIRQVTVNDFSGFLKDHPKITKILLNGSTAYQLFQRHCKEIPIKALLVPSTSPAHARMTYEQKKEAWQKALLQR